MCLSLCVRVGQSSISTVTEIQETAPSATNVATSIKFPPTKGHHREPITSKSLSLACLKPLWRRPRPSNSLHNPTRISINQMKTYLFCIQTPREQCLQHFASENTLVGKHSRKSAHIYTHTLRVQKVALLKRQEKHCSSTWEIHRR